MLWPPIMHNNMYFVNWSLEKAFPGWWVGGGGWLDQLKIEPAQPQLSWGLGWAWQIVHLLKGMGGGESNVKTFVPPFSFNTWYLLYQYTVCLSQPFNAENWIQHSYYFEFSMYDGSPSFHWYSKGEMILPKNFWWISGKFLSNSTLTCRPNSTLVGLSRSWLCFPPVTTRRTTTHT